MVNLAEKYKLGLLYEPRSCPVDGSTLYKVGFFLFFFCQINSVEECSNAELSLFPSLVF